MLRSLLSSILACSLFLQAAYLPMAQASFGLNSSGSYSSDAPIPPTFKLYEFSKSDNPFSIRIEEDCEGKARISRFIIEHRMLSAFEARDAREKVLLETGNKLYLTLKGLLEELSAFTDDLDQPGKSKSAPYLLPSPFKELEEDNPLCQKPTKDETKRFCTKAPFLKDAVLDGFSESLNIGIAYSLIITGVLSSIAIAATVMEVGDPSSRINLFKAFFALLIPPPLLGLYGKYSHEAIELHQNIARAHAREAFYGVVNEFRAAHSLRYQTAIRKQKVQLRNVLNHLDLPVSQSLEQIESTPYFIEALLAETDLSTVYLVRVGSENSLQRAVLKMAKVQPGQTLNDAKERVKKMHRLALKAQAGRQYKHLVPVLDLNLEHNPPFLVMEYVAGVTLEQVLKTYGRLRPVNAVKILIAVGDELDRLHKRGLIHGDLKPSQILLSLSNEGSVQIKILDFENEQVVGDAVVSKPGTVNSLLHHSMVHSVASAQVSTPEKRTQENVRTIAYAALEELKGSPPSIQTDVWKFGALAFESLTGRLHIVGENYGAAIANAGKIPLPDFHVDFQNEWKSFFERIFVDASLRFSNLTVPLENLKKIEAALTKGGDFSSLEDLVTKTMAIELQVLIEEINARAWRKSAARTTQEESEGVKVKDDRPIMLVPDPLIKGSYQIKGDRRSSPVLNKAYELYSAAAASDQKVKKQTLSEGMPEDKIDSKAASDVIELPEEEPKQATTEILQDSTKLKRKMDEK